VFTVKRLLVILTNKLTQRQLGSIIRSGCAWGNRCRPSWMSRFPDLADKESTIPLLRWRLHESPEAEPFTGARRRSLLEF
jgi:hypothetical protein